jgi:hypothetical protein
LKISARKKTMVSSHEESVKATDLRDPPKFGSS